MRNILLSLSPNQITTYIIGIIIIAIGIILVARHLKTKKGREELEHFLGEIESAVIYEISEFLTKLDFKEIVNGTANLADAEAELLSRLYDKIWDLVQKHVDEAYKDNALYIFMQPYITKEFVENFSKLIVGSAPIEHLISGKISDECDDTAADDLEKEYEELNKKIEDDTLAEGDEPVPEINIEEAMPDLEPIIPPSDNGDDFDDVDEVVGEKTEEVGLDEVSKAMAADEDE